MEANRQRLCAKCSRELINASGVHMGTPFAYTFNDPKVLVCAKCYDDATVDDHKVERRP